MENAIETNGLRKLYGEMVAVKGLTLEVPQGEVFGFLGPNGAGKTTSIKMLLSLIAPTAGSARLLGAPLAERATRRRIGFLPEHFRFHDWLSATEFLRLHGQLYAMNAADLRGRIPELLELVGLSAFAHKQLRTYSKGMLQRIGLAQALLNRPALVFLDEPTSGLDPVGRRLVRDIIRRLRQEGTTVFLNSHLLSEIEVTCDRVAFIQHGEVVSTLALSSLESFQARLDLRVRRLTPQALQGLRRWGREITVTAPGTAAPGMAAPGLAAQAAGQTSQPAPAGQDGSGVRQEEQGVWRLPLTTGAGLTPAAAGGRDGAGGPAPIDPQALLAVSLAVNEESALPEINRYLVEQGVEVFAFTPQRLSLEELFIQTLGTESSS